MTYRARLLRLMLSLPVLCFIYAPLVVSAQSNDDFFNLSLEELGQIEISAATGNKVSLVRAPATASVITAAEIKAMGARSLNDVLKSIPGVHVSISDINRSDAIISIRGIHTGFNPHVLLLMNGTPLQVNTQGGRPVLFRLPAVAIDRVEVIRGPGSAVYGADAFSGVINVITHAPAEDPTVSVGGRAGSFDTRDLWLSASNNFNDWGIRLDLAYQHSNGDPDRIISSDLQTIIDQQLMTSASRAPGPLNTTYEILDAHVNAVKDRWDIKLWSWVARGLGNGVGAAQALDPGGGDDSNLYLLDVSYSIDDWLDDWLFNLKTSYIYYKDYAHFTIFPPGAALPIGENGNVNFNEPAGLTFFPDGLIGKPAGTARDANLEFVSLYSGVDNHQIRFSIGTKSISLDTSEKKNFGLNILDGSQALVDGTLIDVSNTDAVYLPDSSRRVQFLSLQDEWQFAEDWQLTAGLRYDNYSDFGETTNPRFALVWQVNDALTSKFLYGSAVRAPSFNELFIVNNPVSLGNPDLTPEQIDTFELAFNFLPTPNTQINFSAFHYTATDMIEYVPVDGRNGANRAENNRDQDGNGAELEFNWIASSSLRFGSHLSWQNAKDATTGKAVPDAPRRQFYLSARWEFHPQWFVDLQYKFIGDRVRDNEEQQDPASRRAPVDDYALLDITLRADQVVGNFDFALAIRNATDTDAREPSSGAILEDYPLASRSIWAEISWSFE